MAESLPAIAGLPLGQGYFDKDLVGFFAVAVYTEADDYLYSYFHSKSTSNAQHLNDPALDAMIDKERSITDEDQRLKAVQDIQKYIAEKVYSISTVGGYKWAMVSPRIKNYNYSEGAGKETDTIAKLWIAR